ncbi:MAG: zinc-binding dehydrogenase [Chloroflexi bacterium]|nr:zinc-binding dehydrogenase [Chloroflexota bacterium]
MKAAVYKGKQRFEVEEIPTPSPGPNQLLVKVHFCAICGTDVHAFLYDIAPPGTVLGHEFAGTVVEVGSLVTAWKVGDRVIGGGGDPPPGQEPGTRTHPRYNYRTMGFPEGSIRGYAEFVLMEEWQPIAIPDGISDEEAAMCEPTAVAVHAVRNSDLKLGDTVGILGAGPIGLLTLQAAKAAGASAVYVSEPAPERSRAATELGADAVINPLEEDLSVEIDALTGGVGPDIVFDCAGFPSTLDLAFNIVRRSGQVVLVAVPWEELPLRPVDWMARETSFKASWGSLPGDWHRAMGLMASGKLTVKPLISEVGYIPLEGMQEAFEGLVKPSTQLQLVVRP